jgi:signal transduction histidine kinase/DNA-binding response OmpR family regulator
MSMARARGVSSIDQTEIRFLVEKNADGIIVVDDDGIVLFANPAAEQIFGRPSELLIGSPIGIPFIAGDTTEIAIHRPGGDRIDAEIRVVETTWDHRPARLASLRDISARRVVEERLRHAAKMEAVGRLTAGIAHDFNNLLTVVLGNLESAQRQSTVTNSALLRALENAMRGATRAAMLTERLLAFARRKPLEPQVLDANALVSGMSDLLQRTLGEGIAVRTTLAADLWSVEADPAELEAAIVNLAVNARDAMPSGGKLVIETANIELDSTCAAANGEMKPGLYALISVTDTGTGMTPEVLKQVFEPFFTTKADGRGTGLGLSQVYGFVKQSGGHVKLYSEPGIGTTARIYLPRATDAHGPACLHISEPKGTDQIPLGRSGETILVVEDDDDVRNYTVNSLRELGYTVLDAADAVSALEIVEREPNICLLFTDLGLPGGVDGRVLAERARETRSSLRVLITTAYAGSALIHEGRLEFGVELLMKPFTFTALATRIREVLDRDHDEEGEEAHILVVEDEPLLRMFIADALAEMGWQAEEATSFSEALAKTRSVGERLAGAIIDLGLPDRPGDELVAEIRALRRHMPIILATGFADAHLHQRFAQDTWLQILRKPFDPSGLSAALRRCGIRVRQSK